MITDKDKIVALIDGDVIAYRAAAVCEEGDADEVIQTVKNFIRRWATDIDASKSIVFVSEGDNFRHDIYPEYKQNRIGKDKPRFASSTKEWMLDNYTQVLSDPRLEADDRLSMYATEDHGLDEVRVIITTDKDMRQVPAYVYNPDYSVLIDRYTLDECMQMLFYQWVCGDRVDGYYGIDNFGVEKYRKWVHRVLDERGDGRISSKDVLELYKDKGYDEKYCLQQLFCATIKHNKLPEVLKPLEINGFDQEQEFYTPIGETRFWRGVKAKV